MKQLVIKGNRVVAHGEDCFLSMGGTVLCTKTGRAFDNATVANITGAIPADIDSVGYEYHAGEFVPCAPFGKGSGNIAVVCNDDCKSIKDSGYLIPNYSNWKLTASGAKLLYLLGSPSKTTYYNYDLSVLGTEIKLAQFGFRALIGGTVNVKIRYRTGPANFVLNMQVDDGEPEPLASEVYYDGAGYDTKTYELNIKAGARYSFWFAYDRNITGSSKRLFIWEVSVRATAPDVSVISDVWSEKPEDVAIFDPVAQLRADVDYIAAQMDITL